MGKRQTQAAQRQRRRAELIYYLRQRNIPIKYQYLGIGARRFDRLSRSPRYIAQSELGLLKEQTGELLTEVKQSVLRSPPKAINIIDIGCGNGEKAAVLIRWALDVFPDISVRYVALDISAGMRKIAKQTVTDKFNRKASRVEVISKTIDFEEENLLRPLWRFRQDEQALNLFLFLGNTLGNVRDPRGLLVKIAMAMRARDWLLLGLELGISHVSRALLEVYSDPLHVEFLSTALRPFNIKPEAGKGRGHGLIRPEINSDENIEIRFKFTHPSPAIRANGEELRFNVGEYIVLAESRRFQTPELCSLLSKSRLTVARKAQKESGSAVYLCRSS